MERPLTGELLHRQRRRLWFYIPFFLFISCVVLVRLAGKLERGKLSAHSLFDWLYLFLMLGTSGIALYWAWWLLRQKKDTRSQLQLWKQYRRSYPDECPWCGYDVRGCPTPICSECGKPIDPSAITDAD